MQKSTKSILFLLILVSVAKSFSAALTAKSAAVSFSSAIWRVCIPTLLAILSTLHSGNSSTNCSLVSAFLGRAYVSALIYAFIILQ